MADSRPEARSAVKRRGHLRLAAFFALLAALACSAGAVWLERVGASPEARSVLYVCVGGTALAGFLGVFIHRRTIARARWRETEEYLARIHRESAKYQALMEGAADMLLVVDPATGGVRERNAAARERLRSGATVDALIAEQDLATFRVALASSVAPGGAHVSLPEVRLRGGDGGTLIADARLASIDLGLERIVHVSLRDLTQKKELERELAIRERLSSIGLLTAGVAHEINNPLEYIGNYLSLLERESLPAAERARHLELVRHGFHRIRDIVRDLLRFARPTAGHGDADLAQVVDRALKLVAYSEKFRGVDIERIGLDAPLSVVGDAGRLEQVVLNLVLNAATAMQSRGKITIRAHCRRFDGSAGEVELAVEDDGPGIPPADLERIFDPFFTSSNGTGLGLAVSYGIVRAHGGSLRAENRERTGARFTITLPLPALAPSSPGTPPRSAKP
ncbi:MAG: two-component system sensor histidine kinase NtrB [Planctomycetota bacterium]